MSVTVSNLIAQAVPAIGLPKDPIQTDVRDVAVDDYNDVGRIIFDWWLWKESRNDLADAPDPDSDGIITFGATVDEILAVKAVEAGEDTGTAILAQNEINAINKGVLVDSDKFVPLPPDSSGNTRIKVEDEDSDNTTWKYLATTKFIEATVESAYDSDNPSATPTDYRVLTFPIYRAEYVVREALRDRLREWAGLQAKGVSLILAEIAKGKETDQAASDFQITPASPAFDEVGEWH